MGFVKESGEGRGGEARDEVFDWPKVLWASALPDWGLESY